jgi:hypothetical protein
MKSPRRKKNTAQIELVETHNLAFSISRLRDGPYDPDRWRRALYHALSMCCVNRGEIEKIRQALNLP